MTNLDLFDNGKEQDQTDQKVSADHKAVVDHDYFERISAFHKELRRGDVAACKYWAMQLGHAKAYGYLASVVLEETSNFNLYDFCFHSSDLDECILAFCGTQKKWEQPSRLSYYDRVKTIHKVESDSVMIDSPEIPAEMLQAWEAKDFESLSKCFWKYKYASNDVRDNLWDGLAFGLYDVTWVPEWNFHEQISLMRLHCLHEDGLENGSFTVEFAEDVDPDYKEIRDIPLYALDKHTKRGARLFYNNIKQIRPNQPLPDVVDLRFSGNGAYIWWRCLAYEQYGRVNDIAWEDVDYPKDQFWSIVKAG